MSFLCNNDEQKNLYLLLKKVNFWTLYTKSFWWRKLFHNSNNNNNRHINLFRITYFKGPIIYFIDGRSSSKHKQRLCIILALPGALMEHLLKGCFKVLVSYLRGESSHLSYRHLIYLCLSRLDENVPSKK